MQQAKAVISAGHSATAGAAAEVLAAGGSAFDAALAAWCAACVAEPVLASLGGGGFLLARPAGGTPVLYDFFVQTPRQRRPEAETDLRPIAVDFGDAVQEFHIGMGAIATPGAVAGLLAVHRDLGRLPLGELVAPACALARDGLPLNHFQHRIARIVLPILKADAAAFAPHASPARPGELASPGEVLRQPELADSLEALALDGERILYDGPWGERLAADCAAGGGHLSQEDLAAYRVVRRQPLCGGYRDTRIHTNPAPALGGPLILFSLRLLEQVPLNGLGFGSTGHLNALARAMALTQRLRREGGADSDDPLSEELMAAMGGPSCTRGTTQISIADRDGNLASLTISNGEGAGYVIPGTGIVMNNMLGEEDINPHGFHRWPTDRRMGSMMAPTLVERADGTWIVTGSSGSNRIRSAVLQVLVNLVDFGLPLEVAVGAPRVHFEGDLLSLEPPVAPEVLAALQAEWPQLRLWNAPSVFFGGAHTVARGADGTLSGAGDPRRGGVTHLA